MKRRSYYSLWSCFKVWSFYLDSRAIIFLKNDFTSYSSSPRCRSFETRSNGSFLYKVTLIYKWSTIFYYHWYSCAVHCRYLLHFSIWHESNSLVFYNLLHVFCHNFFKKIPNFNVTLKWRENSTTIKNKIKKNAHSLRIKNVIHCCK